jgi:hypothetical protein
MMNIRTEIDSLVTYANGATPNDIRNPLTGLELVRGWWTLFPDMGQTIARREVTIEPSPVTWSGNIEVTVTDHTVRATVANDSHVIAATMLDITGGVIDLSRVTWTGVVAYGAQKWIRFGCGAGTAWVNIATREVGTCYDCTASVVAMGDTSTVVIQSTTSGAVEIDAELRQADDDGYDGFVGNVADGFDFATVVVTQTTLTGLTTLARNAGTLLGGDLTQASATLQPIYFDTLQNGVVVPHRRAGRVSSLLGSAEPVVSLVNSDTAEWAIAWAGRFSGANASLFSWSGTIEYDCPICIRTGFPVSERMDDTIEQSTQMWTVSLGQLTAWHAGFIHVAASRLRTLYLNGVPVSTVTMGALGTATMASFGFFNISGTAVDSNVAEVMLFSCPAGSTAEQMELLTRPARTRMARRWGLVSG